ncbi:hypothetical protein QVD17_19349 [Tagetes erecta]|uniref:Uncharacterized protein n=1 Tax=Tagetes erecta TaxID=13708 RepID=A0AAD8NWF4_TARER|nr:hypothetical protein QVD17_19349 [Tagetes erecta]
MEKRWEVDIDERKCTCRRWQAKEVAPMPTKDQWMHIDTEEKRHPATIKRSPRRPRNNRIKPNDETKRKQQCQRCHQYGHHQQTCKNAESQD